MFTPTPTATEAIAAADAAAQSVGLPSYTRLIDVLNFLQRQASLSDLGRTNLALNLAEGVIDQYLLIIHTR